METAPLRSFAAWARTALIREVNARISVVLAPASVERVEQTKAVDALEKAVMAAGGGDTGRTAVADRVAYTWFNRIIALRFMDANGYTGIGVVSPQAGLETGQPEILAEAKRGTIDAAAVGDETRGTVTALLDGTRRSDDAQGEAYALLLTDYCRYWNRAMPFMFERAGDFTELLMPANLLADDSVPSRAVKVLTADACQDVEVIGWLYQFYISERKDEVFAGFKKNKRAGADEIPAATQLFTPHWIVRYLVENSLGRLWMLNHPSSRLVDQMEYYIAPVDDETDFLRISGPEDLNVVDPACGSGHMLTYAFDLLYAIYEEEGYAPSDIPGLILSTNLSGLEIDPRAGALAAFALTMKARAKQRTFFIKRVEPNVCVLEPIHFTPGELDVLATSDGDRDVEAAFWTAFEASDSLGSLIRPAGQLTARLGDHVAALGASDEQDLVLGEIVERAQRVLRQARSLALRHHVVVTNPPYMGSKNMDAALVKFAKSEYPDAKADLMTMFMRRAFELTAPNGYWAMIDLPSWMFLTTFAAFREWLLDESWMQSVVHLGRGVFGSDFGSVAFVCMRARADVGRTGIYRRLFEEHVDVRPNELIRRLFLDATYKRFEVSQSAFKGLPGAPIAYWLSEPLRDAFAAHPALASVISPKQGIKTGNNERFLRYWFEVSQGNLGRGMRDREEALTSARRWFPCQKGGQYRRWYGNDEYVVNWYRDGDEIRNFRDDDTGKLLSRPQNLDWLFGGGVTWGTISSGPSSFRISPPGSISESKGAIAYASNDARSMAALGLLNSSVSSALLAAISPTVDYGEGAIGKLPFSRELIDPAMTDCVTECIEISKRDWLRSEVALDFEQSELTARAGATATSLPSLVEQIRLDAVRDSEQLRKLEGEINRLVATVYSLQREVQVEVPLDRVSLNVNDSFRYGEGKSPSAYAVLARADLARDLVSYAIGCMFGRYSLDEPGLILANQGAMVRDYLAKVPAPTFAPDTDNVIPIVDGDWFEDDIVARFRSFLRTAFGEQDFEENLRFVTESLGVKDIRDYFVRSFYEDHWKRYKKHPIYWLFSSPKGSFNALIYMHRYTPSTASTVLNEYLREFQAKLSSNLQQQEGLAAGSGTPRQQAAAQKEADRLRKVLLELEEYEHDVLYPLASRQLAIDLDDGVKANYPKFGAALKKIAGLGASDE